MKKIALILAFTLLISLVWSLEYDSILSVSEESLSVTSKDSTLYVASLNGISIYNYSNETLELVNTINQDTDMTSNRVYSSGNYLINTNYGCKLYDVTDSQNPLEIRTINTVPNDLIVVGDYLMVKADGIYVYDIHDFDLPPTQILTSAGRIEVVNNMLFELTYNSENHRELKAYSMNLPTDVEFIDSSELN